MITIGEVLDLVISEMMISLFKVASSSGEWMVLLKLNHHCQ